MAIAQSDTINLKPETVALLRRLFRYLNRFMVLMWRLDMLRWFTVAPRYTGQIMILQHTGRKSGLRRRTPLNFAVVDGELYCTSGFGAASHWYGNIMANPNVEVWLPDGRWRGTAEDISQQSNALDLLRAVLIGSGFAAFAAGINPYRISDDDLREQTRGYHLIHITRTQPVTGSDGPGDLSWVWQAATVVLLAMVCMRQRRG